MKQRLRKKKQRKLKAALTANVAPRAAASAPWQSAAFVHVPGDTPLGLVPPWIKGLVVQVAWGSGPPEQPVNAGWLEEARRRFTVYAWAWCNGGDAQAEAEWHRECAQGYAGFCANMEEPYDAHGNSADPRYTMPKAYLKHLNWPGRLAVTTTATFGSDMTAWIQAGALTMPQAFPREVPLATLTLCVEHAQAWGWPLNQIRPLAQAYPTNGARPDPVAMDIEAAALGVGVCPYTIEQAMDTSGQQWLTIMRPSIERPQSTAVPPPGGSTGPTGPPPTQPPTSGLIGSQHGVTASANRLRALDPAGTNPQRDPANLSTYGAWDKWERTMSMLVKDHDARIADEQGKL